MLISLDHNVIEIIILSLQVSLFAIFISCIISMPLAAFLSSNNFLGKEVIIIIINALMSLPPVVVGLFLYLILSSQGFLSSYKILYTPSAMTIAQIIIITPILIALSKESIDSFYRKYNYYFKSIRLSNLSIIKTLIWEARYPLLTNSLAGLGRGLSEVGAIIIVGGNIEHLTRTMTTGIVLETSKGEFSIALQLGTILLIISLFINICVHYLRKL